jgi:cytoskeletal protein RodZ
MEQGTSTTASFTGTLLRREHTLGERFVQLVFREDDRDVLCVSTNPRAATLPIGQSYHVEGVFKQRGTREFIYDPKVALLKKHWRPIRRMMFVVIVVTCVAGLGSVAYMQHGTAKKPSPSMPAQHAVVTTPLTAQTTPSTVTTTSTPTPTSTSAPAVATTKPVTKKTTSTPVTATASDDSGTAAAQTDVCTNVDVPFTSETTNDPTQPLGYSEITQTGQDGTNQVCTVSGTTTVVQMIPQITDVGTGTTSPSDPSDD